MIKLERIVKNGTYSRRLVGRVKLGSFALPCCFLLIHRVHSFTTVHQASLQIQMMPAGSQTFVKEIYSRVSNLPTHRQLTAYALGAERPMMEIEDRVLYTLPPLKDRNLTKLELEFRNMLGEFAHYSQHNIDSLRDPRMRTVFEGIAASAGCAPVYRSFEVLYEDLYPLRVAGRWLYARLQQLMIDSQREREEEVNMIVQNTALSKADVEATRLAFVSVAARLNGDAFLTVDQLRESGLTNTATSVLGYDSVDDLLERLCKDDSNKVTFVDMMVGLQETAESVCGLDRCNPAEVMREIMLELKKHPPTIRTRLDSKRQQYSDHYDAMLAAFGEWESLMPEGDGRRLNVVRGCFVGAKTPPVVEALRIVYVDYAALRVAGDLIFRLVKSVMSAAASRQRRQTK
ncbi:hypothetical protein MPSEU_000516500 [Mayamaea pseudoterrestris]|nr:hypothetical protein MPSEU_000516500 [Mayamaea pseudoterrestris]